MSNKQINQPAPRKNKFSLWAKLKLDELLSESHEFNAVYEPSQEHKSIVDLIVDSLLISIHEEQRPVFALSFFDSEMQRLYPAIKKSYKTSRARALKKLHKKGIIFKAVQETSKGKFKSKSAIYAVCPFFFDENLIDPKKPFTYYDEQFTDVLLSEGFSEEEVEKHLNYCIDFCKDNEMSRIVPLAPKKEIKHDDMDERDRKELQNEIFNNTKEQSEGSAIVVDSDEVESKEVSSTECPADNTISEDNTTDDRDTLLRSSNDDDMADRSRETLTKTIETIVNQHPILMVNVNKALKDFLTKEDADLTEYKDFSIKELIIGRREKQLLNLLESIDFKKYTQEAGRVRKFRSDKHP